MLPACERVNYCVQSAVTVSSLASHVRAETVTFYSVAVVKGDDACGMRRLNDGGRFAMHSGRFLLWTHLLRPRAAAAAPQTVAVRS